MTLRRYEPAPAPLNERNLPEYVLRELRRIAFAFQEYAEAIDAGGGGGGGAPVTHGPGLSVSGSYQILLDVGSLTEKSTSTSDLVLLAFDPSASAHVKVPVPALPSGGGAPFNPANELDILEDLLYLPGTSGQGGIDILTSGTGSSVAAPSSSSVLDGHPGVVQLSTGTASSGYAGMLRQIDITSTSSGGLRLGGGIITYEALVRFLSVGTLAAWFTSRMGLFDELNGPPTNAVSVFGVSSLNGVDAFHILPGVLISSAAVLANTGFAAAANVWYHVRLEIDPSNLTTVMSVQPEGGARVYAATLTATLPTALLNPGIQIAVQAGAVNHQMLVDLFRVRQTFTTPRWT
jgi:hypothetical protein